MANNQASANERAKRHKHEGPQKHIVAFIFSIALTFVAFAAVAAGEINTTFLYIILVVMAILQVFVQMAFWMHMKDRGHLFPTIGILGGVIIVITMIVMAQYWVWW